jgi:transcriptional regulator with XRE-family HTH domain
VSELGQLLKNARMDRKISLEDLEETTKIRKRYLEAIEEGNYKILPGSFYVRAFIKNYAEAVGLDPAEVLSMYQQAVPSSVPEKPSNSNLHNKRRFSRNNDKMSRLASSAMVIGFVILILGLIYYYAFQSSKGSTSQEKTPESKSERITDRTDPKAGQANTSPSSVGMPTHSPTPTPTPTPLPTPTAVKFNKSEKGVDFYTVTGSQKLTIQMKISSSDCWIEVDTIDADGKKTMQKQKTYKDGETDSFVFDSSAYLNVGAAKALELSVNGTLVTVGDSLNPKRIQLDLQKS